MAPEEAPVELRDRVMNGLIAYAGAQSELGRQFARSIHMHTTDSTAILAIINAEERGKPLTPVRLADLTTASALTRIDLRVAADQVPNVGRFFLDDVSLSR